jgi:hypothetical protein
MLAFLAWRRGPSVLRPSRRQLLSCLAVGVAADGRQRGRQRRRGRRALEHGALLIASVPLWVILYRRAARRPRRGDQRRRRADRLRRRGDPAAARQADRRAPLLALLTVVVAAIDVGRRLGRLDPR